MKSFVVGFKKMDWGLVFLALLLVLTGLVSLYSSSHFNNDFSNFRKQIIFLTIGFGLMLFFSFLDWRIFAESPYLILAAYFLLIVFLVLLFFLAPQIRGVKGWFRFGGVFIDPIEPLKIVLIILLAKYFSARHVEMYNFKHIVISGLYVFLPFVLIALQPDLGGALIIFCSWLGILILSGVEVRHFLILLLIVLVAFIFSWYSFLRPYQKQRITSFIFPEEGPFDAGWSAQQARIAIGSGGFWGKGFKKGSQLQLGFLTAPQNDFIFASLAEEFGFFGVSLLLLLISLFFLRIVKIALRVKSNFPRLFSLGFGILLISQSFIHIGMNLGLLPVIGISLPLVSYGGSGLVFTFVGLGFLQSFLVFKE